MVKHKKRCWLRFAWIAVMGWGLNGWGGVSGIRFISHRGESQDAPENTMVAYQLAVARSTAGFELDVWRTSDNEIVCIHDATTTRTTDGSLIVSNSTLSQLKTLDAGKWKSVAFAGERIPALSEALALAHDNFEIYVEIKCGTEILPRLQQVLAAEPKATPARVVFICFSTNVVAALRQQFPAYRTYWLTNTQLNSDGSATPTAASVVSTLQSLNASGVDALASGALNAAYVSTVKNAGYSFHVWTVDTAIQAAAYAAMGVDTITTNCGAKLESQLTASSLAAPGDTVFNPGNGVTQIVNDVVSGNGGVIVNANSAGGGVVILNALNTYSGSTTLGCGTLIAASLANSLWPSAIGASVGDATNLVLGNGTLWYEGPAVTTDRGYTINVNAANPNYAAVLHADGNITFGGKVNALVGNFIKSGTGTVTYAGSGTNQMSKGVWQGANSVIVFNANGDSPAAGYSGFNVTAGKVVFSSGINYFTDELVVGLPTTTLAGKETPAYLDFVGGTNYLGSWLAIGRGNGTTTTAPDGLPSKVTVSGGYVGVSNLSMGYSAMIPGYNACPVLDVTGGQLFISGLMRIGDHAGGHPTVNMRSGNVTAGGFISGIYGATDARVNVMSNAWFEITGACILANTAGSSCVLALHGGTLKVRGVYDADANGNGKLYLNGGTFAARSVGGEGVAASVQAVVSTNGAVFDTGALPVSPTNCFMVYAGLEHDSALGTSPDGGLVKTGVGTLVLAGTNTYTGATAVSNGTLRLMGTIQANATLTLLAGGTFSLTNAAAAPLSVGTLTLGSSGNALPAVLELAAAGGACASVAATNVMVAGCWGVRLVQPGTTNAVAANGTLTVLSFPDGTALNASAVALMNPAPGKTYRFAVTDAGTGRDQLAVTISDTSSVSTWITAAGGSWADAGNWSPAAPANQPGTPVLFTTPAQSGGATVTLPNGATIGSLLLNSAQPYTFSGTGPLVLDNGGAGATWSVTSGSHTVSAPISLDSTASLVTYSNTAQTVSSVISGNGGLQVNPAAVGGGTVTNSGASTYAGATTLGCGTLVATSLANGGQPSAIGASSADAGNLVLGAGTFRYIGPSVTTDRGFTIAPASNKKAAILKTDADITFGGQVQTLQGSLIKTGTGTVTLAGTGAFTISGSASQDINTYAEWPSNGDSPGSGFPSLVVANGKMVWGREGQSVLVSGGEAWIGGFTTAVSNKETTGELEIQGGYTRFDSFLGIGRNNGNLTNAPTPLHPKLTIRDGTVSAYNFLLCYHNAAAQNTRAELEILGGLFQVDNEFRIGVQKGDAAAFATINVRGGIIRHLHASQGLTFGWVNPSCDGTMNVFGGLVDEAATIKLGNNPSTSRFNLHGGTVRALTFTGGSGTEYLYFNGGVFQPVGNGYALSSVDNVTVSTNGAIIDTSLAGPSGYLINQPLLHDATLGGTADGGLVKLGSGLLIMKSVINTYSGLTRVSNGVLRAEGTGLRHTEVRVSPGATVQVDDFSAAAYVKNLVLGESGNASPAFLDLPVNATTLQYAGLTVTNALTAYQVQVGFHPQGGATPVLPTGVYTVLTYNASSPAPDPAVFAAKPGFASKGAAFAVVNGATGWKCVVMTVTNVYLDSAWQTAGNGAWETADNWTTAPQDLAGWRVLFTNALPPSGAAVSLSGVKTAGQMTFDTANSFSLSSGSVTLDNEGSSPRISALHGSHTLASGLSLAGTPELDVRSNAALTVSGVISGNAGLSVNPLTSGGGAVTLSGANTYTGKTMSASGTLTLTSLANGGQPSAAGASSADPNNLTWGAGTLRYEGPEVVTDRGFKTTAASGRAAILSVNTNVTFGGTINCASGSFIKRGKGTVAYTGTGNFTLSVDSGTAVTFPGYPANGDSPTAGFYGFLIADGRMVWGKPGQTNIINNEAWIGSTTTTLAGQETTGELEIRGGYTRMNSYLCLGRNNGNPTTAPVPLRPRLAILGGTLSVASFIHCYDSTGQHYTRPVLDLYGGQFQIDGQFRMGNNRGLAGTPSIATVNIYGGTLKHTSATEGITFGWADPSPEAIFNVFGGLVDEAYLLKMGQNASISRLNLHGGVLKAQNIIFSKVSTVGQANLFFNGGVFQPTGLNLMLTNGFTSATVSTNGACFDTSLAGGGLYTLFQPLAHAAALGSALDGGLVKSGTNTLVLAVTNAFTGPVTVSAGTLRAILDGAIPNELSVLSNAVFDAAGGTRAIPRVTGNGLLSNGTVRVTSQLNPGVSGSTTPGAILTATNLTFAAGATFVCNATTNGLPSGTNDLLAVTGLLTVEGSGYVSFGHTSDTPLVLPYSANVMTYGSVSGSFGGWRARDTGYPNAFVAMRVTLDESGPVKTVRVELLRGGTIMMLR